MRLQELQDTGHKELEDAPRLFIDMDGVLADFFHAWATKHENVRDYNELKSTMDPVEMEHSIEELSKSHKVEDFFAELAPLVGGVKILEWVRKNGIPYTILSCPLRRPGEKASIAGKKRWLQTHAPDAFNPVFRCDKERMAMAGGRPAVLIDDFGKNINKWTTAGGIGIKHDDADWKSTISALENIYSTYLTEGGWASTATQTTVITPSVVAAALKVMARFVRDYNAYAKKNKLAQVRLGHPTGSSAYYQVDPPEKEYGDIDLQIIVPELPEHEGKTYAQVQGYWNKVWDEFLRKNRPEYAHPDSGAGKIVVEIAKDQYVQVDLMPHEERIAKWARYRTTPERGVKGSIRGNLFSVLGDVISMNLQHSGVIYKQREGQKMPYRTTLKNYQLVTLTTDIENFTREIFEHEFELARGRPWTKRDPISPLLVQHPGDDISELKIENLVKSIVGLAESFKLNKLYGLGDLTSYKSEDQFLDEFLRQYEAKAVKDLGSAKRDKASTPETIARAERDRNSIQSGLNYVKKLFTQYR